MVEGGGSFTKEITWVQYCRVLTWLAMRNFVRDG
jgi:hypothetical protein